MTVNLLADLQSEITTALNGGAVTESFEVHGRWTKNDVLANGLNDYYTKQLNITAGKRDYKVNVCPFKIMDIMNSIRDNGSAKFFNQEINAYVVDLDINNCYIQDVKGRDFDANPGTIKLFFDPKGRLKEVDASKARFKLSK